MGIVTALAGWKTYLIAWSMVSKGAIGIAQAIAGEPVEISQTDVNLIMEGFAIMGLRAGIAKTEKPS